MSITTVDEALKAMGSILRSGPMSVDGAVEHAAPLVLKLLTDARAEGRELGRRETLAELSTALGTAEHALDELEGDVDLVRLVVDELKARGATSP